MGGGDRCRRFCVFSRRFKEGASLFKSFGHGWLLEVECDLHWGNLATSFLQFGQLNHREEGLAQLRLLRLDHELDLFKRIINALDADPPEGGLTISGHMSFLNEANRLQNVCDVVKPANLSFESLIVDGLVVSDLTSSLLQRDDELPTHEQVNELLAEVAERLHFFVLGLALSLLAHKAVLFI